MKVRFWGTRGSLAKPGPSTIRYGGNTSCVEVQTDDGTLLILDCGTGAHELAQHLLSTGEQPLRGSVLISHTHWDHIQGIPFFAPFFIPGNEWDMYAPQGFGETLKATLAGQMEYTYFPITPDAFGAKIRYHNVSEGVFQIGNVRVRTRFLNHPALTIAYRIEADGAAVVYACDHEPHSHDAAHAVSALSGQDEAHSDFLRGADLVIHDAQYTAAEYPAKAGWGHSTIEYAVAVCERAGVRQLALTHHDPLRDDEAVDRLLAQARDRLSGASQLHVIAAAEGLVLRVEGAETEAWPRGSAGIPAEQHALITSQRVLVVTQDQDMATTVAAVAGDEGLMSHRVASVQDALKFCMAALPPLIVIDASLPAEVVGPITSAPSAVPILVIGGEFSSSDQSNVEHLGGTVSREYLRSRMRTWLMRGKYASIPAVIPEGEANRLAALRSIRLLDTPPEERFDRLTRIASKLFNTPISLITLVDEDRQWFKSRVGLEVGETPRHMSFCSHAVANRRPLIVHDALQDERFAGNPLVVGSPRIRFYAGVPVHVNNEPIGTLCLIDTKPRSPSEDELQLLKDLASLVQSELHIVGDPAAFSAASGAALDATP